MLAMGGVECDITYNHKAVMINGEPKILIFGSIHYPRSTAETWLDFFGKDKDGGLDDYMPSVNIHYAKI
jgi:beta-galactosidase